MVIISFSLFRSVSGEDKIIHMHKHLTFSGFHANAFWYTVIAGVVYQKV